jgi:methylenetetrahydrofolate dehydrogenase (NADP+)/methenyltetrahydrofolate cyclohydrolase
VTAQLLDGTVHAAAIRPDVAAAAATLRDTTGTVPCLAVVSGGDDPAIRSYARAIGRNAERAGISSRQVPIPAGADDGALRALLAELNADPAIHGVIVMDPLPEPLRYATVSEALLPAKDVDGVTLVSAGRLAIGEPGFVPSTPLGGMELLRRHGLDVAGLEATVVGRSPVVGKPLAQLLLAAQCTVTICHSRTPRQRLVDACRRADVLCAATGRPGLIAADMVKPGAIVLDFGTSPGPDGKLVGDVDVAGAREVAGWITSGPGATGSMTTALLLRNTLEAAQAQAGR